MGEMLVTSRNGGEFPRPDSGVLVGQERVLVLRRHPLKD